MAALLWPRPYCSAEFSQTQGTPTQRKLQCQSRQQSSTTATNASVCKLCHELCHICWVTAANNRHRKGRRPGSADLRVKKCLILPLTYPRHCNGTSPAQLKIAHNQSTGRHISVLLKCINVKCRGQING